MLRFEAWWERFLCLVKRDCPVSEWCFCPPVLDERFLLGDRDEVRALPVLDEFPLLGDRDADRALLLSPLDEGWW